jgi:hypothetical protein
MPSSLAGLIEFRYKGKSFAHFHNDNELDLRLTKNVIKAKGLSHPGDSIYHPNRSRNSAWIEIRFNDSSDLVRISDLVRLAVTKL